MLQQQSSPRRVNNSISDGIVPVSALTERERVATKRKRIRYGLNCVHKSRRQPTHHSLRLDQRPTSDGIVPVK